MLERLQKRYELAISDQYKELRKEVLDYLVESSSNISGMDLPAMLRLINIVDGWVGDYEGYIARIRKEKEID